MVSVNSGGGWHGNKPLSTTEDLPFIFESRLEVKVPLPHAMSYGFNVRCIYSPPPPTQVIANEPRSSLLPACLTNLNRVTETKQAGLNPPGGEGVGVGGAAFMPLTAVRSQDKQPFVTRCLEIHEYIF